MEAALRAGGELFYIADDASLMSVDFSETKRGRDVQAKPLFRTTLANTTRSTPYDVASDGTRFLLMEHDSSVSESGVELLLNWPSLVPN